MKDNKFIFLRHGEVHNPKRVLYGRQPRFGLSEKGRQEAVAASLSLESESIVLIFASPLLRTRQTAGIIGRRLGIKPRYTRHILEVSTIFEKIPLQKYHKEIQNRLYSIEYVKKGQESVEAIAGRMMRFVAITARKYPAKNILVVSHGDPILILKASTLGIEFTWNYKRSNYLQTGKFLTANYQNGVYRWQGK